MAASRIVALVLFLGYWLDDGASAAFLPATYQRHQAFRRFVKDPSCTDKSLECQTIANMCNMPAIKSMCPKSCNPSCQQPQVHGGLGLGLGVWRMHQLHNLQHGGARYVKKHVGGGIFGVSAGSGALPTATISRRLHLNALTHGARVPLAHRLAFSTVAPYSKLFHLGTTGYGQALRINKNPFARRLRTAGLLSTVGGCKDVATKCAIMAAAGKCEKTPVFMHRICRQSCNACVHGVHVPVRHMTKAIKHMQNASL